jgi:hypothetical protein
LATQIRTVVPKHQSALLSDIVGLFPVEQGAAEIVAYLSLDDDDLEVSMDETEEMLIDYDDGDSSRRVRLPRVTVSRR